MPNFIFNAVKPLNAAAQNFTRQHLLNADGEFCMSRLIPLPDILTKLDPDGSSGRIVSPAGLRQFKLKYKDKVNTKYEAEGLLYVENEEVGVLDYCLTKACFKHLMEAYGTDNWYDFALDNWGCKWDAVDPAYIESDDLYVFQTPWDAPFAFMEAVTDNCPEGHWSWYCENESGTEGLLLELTDHAVILVQHWLERQEDEFTEDNLNWSDDSFWGEGGAAAACLQANALELEERYEVSLHNYLN